jgi:hypothetical protein
MWLAGSFASLSPSHSYLYTLFGANRLPADVFGEAACGTIQIGLFKVDGSATMEAITVYRTGLGDLRIHVPVARAMGVAMVVLPLAKLARSGILHGVVAQVGKSVFDATNSPDVEAIADDKLVFGGLERNGRHYHAPNEEGCLVIPVAAARAEITVYTVALTSLSDDRILSAKDAGTAGRPWQTLSRRPTNVTPQAYDLSA